MMESKGSLVPVEILDMAPAAITRQADTDSQIIGMWLHGRSIHTRRAYERDAGRFLAFTRKALAQVTLQDVQDFADSLSGLSLASQGRTLAAVKSLLAFAHKTGYLRFNVGAAVRCPKLKDTLAERILEEEQLQRILALETDPRNAVLLRLLYASGARVSEICGLRWKDCQKRDRDIASEEPGSAGDHRSPKVAGQVTLFGKGGKTRTVRLSPATWKALLTLKGRSAPDDPVFISRKGGPLDSSQVRRIVRAAGLRAGVAGVSPHWLRHSHGSHALDRGAPISLVRETLGHSSIATTGRYLHARPKESSSKYLPV